mmetsp:Transcript_34177/g.80964  ORF Transcript_34177/g.80964 Transcript_34177/m.80964 type:complete len:219 (-) Transcript_34177:883-1539(-)
MRFTVKPSPPIDTRQSTSPGLYFDQSGDRQRISVGDRYSAFSEISSLRPSVNFTTILPLVKSSPWMMTGVLPVIGPSFGSRDCTAYGGPTMPDTSSVNMSSSQSLAHPPWQKILALFLSKHHAASSRGAGGVPPTIPGADIQVIVLQSSTSILLRYDQAVRSFSATVCPPKQKSMYEGTEGMPSAMCEQRRVGAAGFGCVRICVHVSVSEHRMCVSSK